MFMGVFVSFFGTTTTVVSVAAILSFFGAIAATQVMYLELWVTSHWTTQVIRVGSNLSFFGTIAATQVMSLELWVTSYWMTLRKILVNIVAANLSLFGVITATQAVSLELWMLSDWMAVRRIFLLFVQLLGFNSELQIWVMTQYALIRLKKECCLKCCVEIICPHLEPQISSHIGWMPPGLFPRGVVTSYARMWGIEQYIFIKKSV